MGEAPKELQLQITGHEDQAEEDNPPPVLCNQENTILTPQTKTYKWWIRVSVYSLFVLSGQAVATLLGRLYYDKGGNSIWLATLVQLAGFPILIPFYYFKIVRLPMEQNTSPNSTLQFQANPPPSSKKLALVYVSLGTLIGFDCFLYSIGLRYLPVSTYSLICATQLAFNAGFSFFLNSQKFTPFIINSLVLLTISSILLVFQPDSQTNPAGTVSKAKYAIGFICTIAASAGYGLVLSLTQFSFSKIIKQETVKAVLDMLVYESIVATSIVLVGLFASGEWQHLKHEMDNYRPGRVSYVMTLAWTAIAWEVFAIGSVSLIFEVSSLFSNSISAVGLPIVPIFAAVFFRESMGGVKVVAIVLAVWGFVSYVYQHYLDDVELKKKKKKNTSLP